MKHFMCAVCIALICAGAYAGTLYKSRAEASYYAEKFHGRQTANGEVFNMYDLTAAHKTLPFNTVLRVTNLANGKTVDVRINDRGPFVKNREIDLSKAAAVKLGMIKTGTAAVSLEIVSRGDGQRATSGSSKATPMWTPPPHTFWDIQLGAYSNMDNARRLATKLSSRGFNATYQKSGTIIRVVLARIPATDMQETERRLKKAGFNDYAVKQRK